MDKDDKVAVSIIMAGAALAGLIAANVVDAVTKEEPKEQVVVEDYIPTPGTFYCEYYKAKTQVVEDVYDYHVYSVDGGWNWVLSMDDGTTLYYVQTAGQFCYVTGDGDED